MAEIVGGLFGVTPESLQAQRDAAVEAQALQYAQLNPFQQAQMSIYSGANKLGGGIAGLLGAQDPEMMRIQQRQKLLQGVDIGDPKALRERAAVAMQQNDYAAAQQLLDKALSIEAKVASTAKDVAAAGRERAQGTPADIAKAQRIAALKSAIPAYEAAGDMQTTQQLKDELAVLTADKVPAFGVDREAIAGELFNNKTFSQLTPAEKAIVNKRVQDEQVSAKKAGAAVLPGQQVPQKEWLPFAEYLDKNPTIKKTTELISAAPSALETIRMSTTNDIASAALNPQLARMAGETGSLSANDVNRWAKTGGLDDRLISSATSFFTGKPTVAKKEQAEKYVTAVFRGALLEQKRMLQDKAKEFGYTESPNYQTRLQAIDNQLARFQKPSEKKPVDSVVRIQPTGNPLIDKYLTP